MTPRWMITNNFPVNRKHHGGESADSPPGLVYGGGMMNYDNVPRLCQEYRKRILRVTQNRVAQETGYSPETVSAFENGRVNNARLLYWYICNGLKLEGEYNGQKARRV